MRNEFFFAASALAFALCLAGCDTSYSSYQNTEIIETVRCPFPDSFDANGICPKPTDKGGKLRFAVSVERQSVIRNVVEFEPGNSGSFTEELKGCAVMDEANWTCRSSFGARPGDIGVITFVEMRDGRYRADMINQLGTVYSYASKVD